RLSQVGTAVSSLRITVLTPGDRQFVCDRIISLQNGNAVGSELLLADTLERFDMTVEAFGQQSRIFSGEVRNVNPTSGAPQPVLVAPVGDFGCLPRMKTARAFHSATLLPNGQVLLAGGLSAKTDADLFAATDSVEIYDPSTHSFIGNLSRFSPLSRA